MALSNQTFDTVVSPVSDRSIAEAAALVLAGQPVAVPTETVYGLAADATQGDAVARIYAAKGRPSFNPLIVHVLDLAAAEALADLDDTARGLADRFWPGPLTMVLPLRQPARVAGLVTAGLQTVALRSPSHPAIRSLLKASGRPLAAPSANASGRISPTRAEHVLVTLRGRIPMVLDGGPTPMGLESTIVAPGPGGVRLLRPGPIAAEALGVPVIGGAHGGIEAPGQLASHYAPTKRLRLNALEAEGGEWLIGFGDVQGRSTLSPAGDLVEAAANLFERLHEAEAQTLPRIAVAPVPEVGLGAAINDRLRRAAADRDGAQETLAGRND